MLQGEKANEHSKCKQIGSKMVWIWTCYKESSIVDYEIES